MFLFIHYNTGLDKNKMRKLHNKFMNKRCFIVGNGPSLNVSDLELLSNEITFSSNGIYKFFSKTSWRPTFWVWSDNNLLKIYPDAINNLKDNPEINCIVSSRCKNLISNINNDVYYFFEEIKFILDCDKSIVSFSKNASRCIGYGGTVTYCAIQLAIYMGFNKIYLIGVDHQYSKVIDNKGILHTNINIQDYPPELTETTNAKQSQPVKYLHISTKAYREAKKQASKLGIEIYNATRGGVLEVFQRVNLDDILSLSN
jgi:hypothetical protein